MTIWRITIRGLGLLGNKKPHIFSWLVATRKYATEKEAVETVKKHHTPEWWEAYIITALEPIGELVEAQGMKLPVVDDDEG